MDNMELSVQKKYIEDSGIPISSVIYSGNRSLHFLIVLDEPFISIDMWRFYNQWILNVLTMADQQIKNPSRSTRFPDHHRKDGRALIQAVIKLERRVSQEDLFRWLFRHESQIPIQRTKARVKSDFSFDRKIPPWVQKDLEIGIDIDRNQTWFNHSCSCFKNNWEFDDLVYYLEQYFEPEHDFTRNEWLGCIKSAFKTVSRED